MLLPLLMNNLLSEAGDPPGPPTDWGGRGFYPFNGGFARKAGNLFNQPTFGGFTYPEGGFLPEER